MASRLVAYWLLLMLTTDSCTAFGCQGGAPRTARLHEHRALSADCQARQLDPQSQILISGARLARAQAQPTAPTKSANLMEIQRLS